MDSTPGQNPAFAGRCNPVPPPEPAGESRPAAWCGKNVLPLQRTEFRHLQQWQRLNPCPGGKSRELSYHALHKGTQTSWGGRLAAQVIKEKIEILPEARQELLQLLFILNVGGVARHDTRAVKTPGEGSHPLAVTGFGQFHVFVRRKAFRCQNKAVD